MHAKRETLWQRYCMHAARHLYNRITDWSSLRSRFFPPTNSFALGYEIYAVAASVRARLEAGPSASLIGAEGMC
jgi:hypothetical protein